MKKKWIFKTGMGMLCLLLVVVCLSGCSNGKKETKTVTKKNIMLSDVGVESLRCGDKGSFETIYFGDNGKCEWELLNPKESSFQDENHNKVESILLLSHVVYDEAPFTPSDNNIYKDSDIRVKENALAGRFLTEKESAALINTTLKGGNQVSVGSYTYNEAELVGDKFFAPTATMMNNAEYGVEDRHYRQRGHYYWLSAGSVDDKTSYGYISKCGVFAKLSLDVTSVYMRIATNLNPKSIAFISAAKDGKVSGQIGNKALKPVLENSGLYEYKITLKDDTQKVIVNGIQKDKDITFDYEVTGEANRLSAIILDQSGKEIMYYGHIADITEQKIGKASLVLPEDFVDKKYQLKVFSEQYHEDTATDYASEFVEINI